MTHLWPLGWTCVFRGTVVSLNHSSSSWYSTLHTAWHPPNFWQLRPECGRLGFHESEAFPFSLPPLSPPSAHFFSSFSISTAPTGVAYIGLGVLMAIVVLKSAGIVAWVLYLTHWAGPKLTLICTYVSARLWHQTCCFWLVYSVFMCALILISSLYVTFFVFSSPLNFHPYTNTQWMIWDVCCYHIPAHPRLFACSTGTHTCQTWDKRG